MAETLNQFLKRTLKKENTMPREAALAAKYHRFKSYILRTCKNCKWCSICEKNIMAGEKYRDGNSIDNLAHETCVDKIGAGI